MLSQPLEAENEIPWKGSMLNDKNMILLQLHRSDLWGTVFFICDRDG
ncbi:hypothetical protein [Bacillus sp. ISL-7]|nr:hypothetical protein [Bacillus sp. ISL-7]